MMETGTNTGRTPRTPIRPENFRTLVTERLNDAQLRLNLDRATETSQVKRAAVVADYAQWEQMRTTAHDIKRHVIANLAMYLDRFERAATASGMKVLYARDAAEACAMIIDITKRHGGRLAVKSKSMVSEEIGLGHALEREGVTPVETDLGEYIVQLAGEPPSHITGPAMHMSREQIGRLFTEKLGIGYTSDPETLTAVARKVLREQFLTADVGMSGVNFAVASTGTLCIVENEGNARMSTSMPRVHIALTGIEKIVPDDASLAHFLNMLGRSATGQRITCYTSLIRGPRREAERDGPDEVYVVLLDNGRTRMLADPVLREALYCIRCGACLNICPVYGKVGGHAYGSVYPGPIGSVVTPVLEGFSRAKDLPYASSLCGACAEVCPVHIDLHHILLRHRHVVVKQELTPRLERMIMRAFVRLMRSPRLYWLAGRLGAAFMPLLPDDERGMPSVPVWSRDRAFPRMPAQSFKDLWKVHERERDGGAA